MHHREQVCEVVASISSSGYIFFLQNQQEVQEQMNGLRDGVGFPEILAAVDSCDVPITAPESLQSPEDYVTQKGFHAVTLQGLVESNCRFVEIFVGWPAKVHDPRAFKISKLFSHCCARTFLLLEISRVISGVRVPPLIVGDSAYTISDWPMKPYTDNGN